MTAGAEPVLDGAIVALSLGPPRDMVRLGYLEREFEALSFELALQIVRRGGRVLYGGHLQAGGTTLRIFEHLAAAYASGAARRDPAGPRPFINLLAGSELRKTSFDRLAETLRLYQGFVEVRVIVDEAGGWLRLHRSDAGAPRLHLTRNARPIATLTGQADLDGSAGDHVLMSEAEALSAMRGAAVAIESARIVAGGRRGDLGVPTPEGEDRPPDRFGGAMPGIFEEVATSLPAAPVAVLAAWGGAAREAAFELGMLGDEDARVPYLGQVQDGVAEGRRRLAEARDALSERRRREQSALAAFARRDDTGTVARDVVRELARLLTDRA